MKAIPIELDKQRRLRYDLTALADIEERLGVDSITEFFEQPLKFSTIRTILWAGLIHEDENLTEREVGRWIDGDNYKAMYEITTQALMSAFPSPNGNNAPDPTPPPPGGSTGADSSG
jgi:hypothetical protein